jgi:7,8-dihydroneopterin aldolase/epimerase/oxygenase
VRYRLYFREFTVNASIGIHEAERRARQRLRVDVDLLTERAAPGDHIQGVLDYDTVHASILALAAGGHFDLQETFCERVLASLAENPLCAAAVVSTGKLDIFADVARVGCTASWARSPEDEQALARLMASG